MASVPLSFAPPTEPDITALRIYESDNPISGFILIESIPVLPPYINHYTTTLATRVDDWFAIAWENSAGVVSPLSSPIKGGTTTLVGEIVDRVLLRLPDANENIVLQEAEATIEFIYKTDDPYLIDYTTVDRLWLTEITNLVVVASQYLDVVTRVSSGQDYTAGMISERTTSGDTKGTLDSLERLERRALRRLGIGGSLIATIKDKYDCGQITGQRGLYDSSRVLSTRAIITEHIAAQDIPTGVVISDR